jgi:hypothetical protein
VRSECERRIRYREIATQCKYPWTRLSRYPLYWTSRRSSGLCTIRDLLRRAATVAMLLPRLAVYWFSSRIVPEIISLFHIGACIYNINFLVPLSYSIYEWGYAKILYALESIAFKENLGHSRNFKNFEIFNDFIWPLIKCTKCCRRRALYQHLNVIYEKRYPSTWIASISSRSRIKFGS